MRMRLLGAVVLILAVVLGIRMAMERSGSGGAAQGNVEAKVVVPAPKPVVPASSQVWRRVWTYPAGAPVAGVPVSLGDGWVVATDKGRVVALDGKGQERWSHTFAGMSFAGSPAVAGDVVVVAGSDGAVGALGAAAGNVLWQVPGTASVRHGPRAIRVGDAWRVVLVANADGVLHCLDAKTGQEVWKSEPTNRTDGPAAGDGQLIVYGNCDAAVHFFDAATGTHKGSVPVGTDAQMAGGIVLHEGRAYGGTRAGELVCADAGSLALVWHVSVAGAEAYSTPAVAKGLVVMGTPEGKLAAFDAKDGTARWSVALSGTVSAVCVVDDAVFVADGGTLTGLRLADGGKFTSLPVGDNVAGPACNNRVMAVADDGGNVIAVAGE